MREDVVVAEEGGLAGSRSLACGVCVAVEKARDSVWVHNLSGIPLCGDPGEGFPAEGTPQGALKASWLLFLWVGERGGVAEPGPLCSYDLRELIMWRGNGERTERRAWHSSLLECGCCIDKRKEWGNSLPRKHKLQFPTLGLTERGVVRGVIGVIIIIS